MLVNFVNNMVKENMGVKMMKYAPYIATLLIYAVFGALISMIGLRSMTADINVTATWALMTFVLITYNKIKANGFKGYLKSFAQPVAFILPLNIISEVHTCVYGVPSVRQRCRRHGNNGTALWCARLTVICTGSDF